MEDAAGLPRRHARRAPGLPPRARSPSTSATSAPCASTGPEACERLQATFTNDLRQDRPGRAQYTHLLDDADGSVVDDIIVWWVADDDFDVMPNASNTARVRGAVGGVGRHRRTGDHRRAGPARPGPPGGSLRRGRRGGPLSMSPGSSWGGVGVRGRRYRLHRRGRCRVRRAGRRRRRVLAGADGDRACNRPAWGRATRCGSRPACRCTVTSSDRGSRRCRPASAGWWRGTSGGSRGRARSRTGEGGRRRPTSGRLATEGRQPPRAGAAVLVDGEPVGDGDQRQLSPVLEHGIALAFVPTSTLGARGDVGRELDLTGPPTSPAASGPTCRSSRPRHEG